MCIRLHSHCKVCSYDTSCEVYFHNNDMVIGMKISSLCKYTISNLFHYRHFAPQVNIFLECYLSHLFDDCKKEWMLGDTDKSPPPPVFFFREKRRVRLDYFLDCWPTFDQHSSVGIRNIHQVFYLRSVFIFLCVFSPHHVLLLSK